MGLFVISNYVALRQRISSTNATHDGENSLEKKLELCNSYSAPQINEIALKVHILCLCSLFGIWLQLSPSINLLD